LSLRLKNNNKSKEGVTSSQKSVDAALQGQQQKQRRRKPHLKNQLSLRLKNNNKSKEGVNVISKISCRCASHFVSMSLHPCTTIQF
jgi:hypothetical protein